MPRFKVYTVYLLYSGLDNEDERQSTPLTVTLHCAFTRRVSLRYAGETGTRKPPQQRLDNNAYAPRLRMCTQPTQLLLLAQLLAYTQPALRTGLMAPASSKST